jgi:hypothetical protein
MAAAIKTTANTSLASDFLADGFVRDLMLIPVLFCSAEHYQNSSAVSTTFSSSQENRFSILSAGPTRGLTNS